MRGAALVPARALLAGIALMALLPGAAAAQIDPGAPEGARQTVQGVAASDSYALPVGPFALDKPGVRELEGAVARSAYVLDDPQASVADVLQGYRERLQALGFAPLFSCAGKACGGFDFRFGAEILPPPGMLVDVRDFAQLSAARDAPAAFFSVLASRVLESVHIQTVSVEPLPGALPAAAPADGGAPPAREQPGEQAGGKPVAGPPPAGASGDIAGTPPDTAPGTPSDTARPPPPATSASPADTRDLRARLLREGHVPMNGVDFQVGGAALSPGSDAAIDAIARMLGRDAGLSLFVVGHSDNQGPLDLNIDLSRQRAEAVRRALVGRGVAADRLEARGVGFLAPVASNATEEGRALNRRVELVLR